MTFLCVVAVSIFLLEFEIEISFHKLMQLLRLIMLGHLFYLFVYFNKIDIYNAINDIILNSV